MDKKEQPLLVIVGPTASGKSDLAVACALRYGGEIISADSRQIYQSLSVTTGTIPEEEREGIPHHLLAIVACGQSYDAHQFQDAAIDCVTTIRSKGALPIVAGGTSFYIHALLFKNALSGVPVNKELRQRLQGKSAEELCLMLEEKDQQTCMRIDTKNPHRLMRALEIVAAQGSVLPQEEELRYKHVMVGIRYSRPALRERIIRRIDNRFDTIVLEIQKALDAGVDPAWLDSLGMECRHIKRMLVDGISKEETHENLVRATVAYAKRQETWLKRYPAIHWFSSNEQKAMYQLLDGMYQQ